MAGTPDNPGLMARSVEHIFSTIESQGRRAKIKLSYLEIYNEQIRDLLCTTDESKELKIVDDPENGICVTNLGFCYPESTEQVLELIQIGNNRRTQAQTETNPVSSRSHAVCQIVVENCDDVPGVTSDNPIGKLSLIDLAGSERATTNTGIRLKESAKINCSLLALSNCINALCTQCSFIPFRQSKLTRLLKDSLGGNCKTVCLSCVSPSYSSYDDTYSTLQYANKTKNIRTNVTKNTLNVKARISQYPQIIAELRAQIQELKTHEGNPEQANEFHSALEEPFAVHCASIQSLITDELDIDENGDPSDVLQRIADRNLKRQLTQKIAVFASECNRLRPDETCTALIDTEQRLMILELENVALKGHIEVQEKLIHAHHTLIRNASERDNRAFLLPEPDSENFFTAPRPLAARRANERTDIARGKVSQQQEAKLQTRFKRIAESKRPPRQAEPLPATVNSAARARILLEQLSQRVAAVSKAIDTPGNSSSILLRTRLLAQKAPR
jgi:hypothetical protein